MLVFLAVLATLAAIAVVALLRPERVREGLPSDARASAARDLLVGHVSLGFNGLRFGSALTGEASAARERLPGDERRLVEAESLLDVAWRTDRLDPRYPAALGHVALARGELARAERRYRAAIDLDAGCSEARLGLGVALAREALTQGDLLRTRALVLEAIGQFAAVRRESAWYAHALFDRALLLPDVGRETEARTLAAEYFRDDSASAWADRLRERLAEPR